MVFTWFFGRQKAYAFRQSENLHSLPHYHGSYVALWCGIPALVILFFWAMLSGYVIDNHVGAKLIETGKVQADTELSLKLNQLKLLAKEGRLFQHARKISGAAG